jgi:hypothetical protein
MQARVRAPPPPPPISVASAPMDRDRQHGKWPFDELFGGRDRRWGQDLRQSLERGWMSSVRSSVSGMSSTARRRD